MKHYIVTTFHGSLIRGIIALIIGGLAVFIPDITLQGFVICIGILLLASGLTTLIFSVRSHEEITKNILMANAVFNLIFGLLFVLLPTTMVNIFVIAMGVGFLLIGIFQLIGTLSIRHMYGWSWIYFSISMLIIIAGIVLFTNPFTSAQAILIFIGIFLLIYGASELYMAWKLNKKPKNYNDNQIE
ncbi:MAG TPA: DUF308 domain-containing protein [Dysgonamonadaceae bacterium]|nr:DUF308 domain-containing protein [Dysgonamonadaceae bacterium]